MSGYVCRSDMQNPLPVAPLPPFFATFFIYLFLLFYLFIYLRFCLLVSPFREDLDLDFRVRGFVGLQGFVGGEGWGEGWGGGKKGKKGERKLDGCL